MQRVHTASQQQLQPRGLQDMAGAAPLSASLALLLTAVSLAALAGDGQCKGLHRPLPLLPLSHRLHLLLCCLLYLRLRPLRPGPGACA